MNKFRIFYKDFVRVNRRIVRKLKEVFSTYAI